MKDFKLVAAVALELVFIGVLVISSLGPGKALRFAPEAFSDNARERANITVDDAARFTYDESLIVFDDEGNVIGEDLLTGKFALGSGAYDIKVDYKAEEDNAYVELFSESHVTETLSDKIALVPKKTRVTSRVYVPFLRSMHDIQMNIHYTGPGELAVYGIELKEDTGYRWVPVAGYALLFCFLDLLLWLIFAKSGHGAREYVREHYELAALAAIAVLASLPVFADFLYVGHDMGFHLARIIAVAHELSYGQFPVRMLTDMLEGYGYPTSTYYCDFFLYPFALLYLLKVPLRMCWQLYVIFINILTVLISWLCFKRISGRVDTALTGTAIYTLSAYRIVDVYLRSAMGEFTAMAFIPLIILGMWLVYYAREDDGGWLFLGLGMSAVALCHLLSIEMISLFLILFCLMEYKKTFTRPVLISIAKAALMTVLLSLWFILPMLLSMRGMPLSMYEHQTYIQSEGVYPAQIFNMFMRGTGYSTTATPMEMPLSIGGGMIIALAMLIYAMIRRDEGERHRQKVVFVLILLSLVLSMYFFPWDSIAGITEGSLPGISRLARMVQYPWRFLEMTTALLSITAVCLLKRSEGRYRLWTALLLFGTVISLGAFYDPFINEADWSRAADEHYLDVNIGREEYLPADSGRLMDLSHSVETSGGNVQISSYETANGERRLTLLNGERESEVLIPLFAYDGYHAEDQDTRTPIELDAGENHRVRLHIPGSFEGTVRIYYREPLLWRFLEAVSAVSFIVYGIYIVMTYIIKKRAGRDA